MQPEPNSPLSMLSNFNWRLFLMCVLVIGLAPSLVWGQAAATASILGKVADQSGAVLPGVTVTATSPALQVPQVTTATDSTGNYQLRDLPAPGLYRVSFEMAGFQTFVHDGLNLSTGFAARVDANMMIGSITQTVEVSGQSPVVDTIESSRLQSIQQQELSSIPRGGGFQELYPMAAGLSVEGKPDVGDSNLGKRNSVSTYGAALFPTIRYEGIDIVESGHDSSTGMYLSSYNLAEVQFKSSGQNADVARPGYTMESIMKSGGNDTHGSILVEYQDGKFQSNNVTPELEAQGIQVTNPLKRYYTIMGDIGGRIIRDKLWYYGGLSKQSNEAGQIAFVAGPNAQGCWTCGDAPPAYIHATVPQYYAKFNYQPRSDLRLIAAYTHSGKTHNAFNASSTIPLPSATQQKQNVTIWKGEVQWTVSRRMVINAIYGVAQSRTTQFAQEGMDEPGKPSSREQTTGLYTGPTTNSAQQRPSFRRPLLANVVYSAGSHQLKFGVEWVTIEGRATQQVKDVPHGDYQLRFNKGLPYQIITYNFPVFSENRFNSQAFYATDSWKLGRVTFNYGLRWDRYHAFYPDQHKPAGQLSKALDVTGQDVLTWKDLVPRIGGTWDIFGRGKTVVKGGFGIFGDSPGGDYAGNFNPNSVLATTYRWSGPCVNTGFNNVSYNQPNTSCDVAPATLAALNPNSPSYIPNNPNYVSATGGITVIPNPDVKQGKIYNYTARLEQELVPNVAVSVGFVENRIHNNLFPGAAGVYNSVYPNRPYGAYTIAVPLVDPFTGKTVNVYTYPSSYKGATFDQTMHQAAPNDRPDWYTTWEFTVTKRNSKRWNGSASFWTTQRHKWLRPIPASPNDDPFPLDETRIWEVRGTAMFKGPWGLELSCLYRAQAGIPGQRTVNFTSPLLLQGTVTMPMEDLGAQKGPMISVANLKLSKVFKLGEARRLAVSFQSYNLFNTSASTSVDYLTGPTYGRVTGIVDPRVERISMEFKF
jgi:hypothetical protein